MDDILHVQESVNLTIYLYAQTIRHRRMLYIRKFYVVKNIYIYDEKRNLFSFIYIYRWDTGTQLQRGRQGGHRGGYINNDGDTGNIRLAITFNKAQGQSLES